MPPSPDPPTVKVVALIALYVGLCFAFGYYQKARTYRGLRGPELITVEVRGRPLRDDSHGALPEYRLRAELTRDPEEHGAWRLRRLYFPNGGYVSFASDAMAGERLRPEKWNVVSDDRGGAWQVQLPNDNRLAAPSF